MEAASGQGSKWKSCPAWSRGKRKESPPWAVVAYPCNSSYRGGISRRMTIPGQPRQKARGPIWKITKAKNIWGNGSSGGASG
jgi:hypothetical protein